MKNQNNGLERKNLFFKIKSWLYNLFYKSSNINEENIGEPKEANQESITKNKEQNVFDEYRKMNERYQYLLQLQKRFENKNIHETDMNQNDKKDLEKLYIQQIGELKVNIGLVESKIKKITSN